MDPGGLVALINVETEQFVELIEVERESFEGFHRFLVRSEEDLLWPKVYY